jgi:hypothetical protein
MRNIKFNYLYRDGANYKSWGDVVFTNPDQLSVNEVEKRLVSVFLPDKLFVASQISIPEKFLFLERKFTKNDHCYHEFDSVELCQENSTDSLNRSITDFLKEVELIARQGWKAFDFLDHFDTLIDQAHNQAKKVGLKQSDVTSAITKARGHKN